MHNNKSESLPFEMLTDLAVGEDYDDIIEAYGMYSVTKVCLKYLAHVNPLSRSFNSNRQTEELVKGLTYYIEKDSKARFPELWV